MSKTAQKFEIRMGEEYKGNKSMWDTVEVKKGKYYIPFIYVSVRDRSIKMKPTCEIIELLNGLSEDSFVRLVNDVYTFLGEHYVFDNQDSFLVDYICEVYKHFCVAKKYENMRGD